MKLESGRAKNATAFARSPGCASLRMGIAFSSAVRSFGFSSLICANIGVSAGPGHTQFALMPLRAISRANVLVNEVMPPFAAAAVSAPLEPTRPLRTPAVRLDAVARHIPGERLGERDDAALGRRVHGLTAGTHTAGIGADTHHGAGSGPDHVGGRGLRAVERADQVDADDAVPR